MKIVVTAGMDGSRLLPKSGKNLEADIAQAREWSRKSLEESFKELLNDTPYTIVQTENRGWVDGYAVIDFKSNNLWDFLLHACAWGCRFTVSRSDVEGIDWAIHFVKLL